MDYFLFLLLFITSCAGVLTKDSTDRVTYPDHPICALRGFIVSIPCSYSHQKENKDTKVNQVVWCSMESNTDKCHYKYTSSSGTKSDFEYTGDYKSNCSLVISNVQFSYSGVYRFRFITNVDRIKYTGLPGVTLRVADLKVSLISLSGNQTFKQGDSLNLTCDVNCTQRSSQFVWFKNNKQLNTSGPVLHFPDLTMWDSGNYTCTWKTDFTSGSKSISFTVEGNTENPDGWSVWMIVLVTAGVIFFSLFIIGGAIYSRRFLCKRSNLHTEQQQMDDSDIYANVQENKYDSDIYANGQENNDSEIYNNVS